jgi:hypothetical protein
MELARRAALLRLKGKWATMSLGEMDIVFGLLILAIFGVILLGRWLRHKGK